MIEKFFVDTNILVYSRDLSSPQKQARAAEWMAHLWSTRTGRLSLQVLNEFYAVVTRKLKPGLDEDTARREIRDLFAWKPLPIRENVLTRAWEFQDDWNISFWDSMILSAAEIQDCRYILSEDLKEQEYGAVEVINPFRHKVGDIGS